MRIQFHAENDDCGLNPICVAKALIEHKTHIPRLQLDDEVVGGEDCRTFNTSALRQIAEHLLVYCNNNCEG